jgi:hypothetical protein
MNDNLFDTVSSQRNVTLDNNKLSRFEWVNSFIDRSPKAMSDLPELMGMGVIVRNMIHPVLCSFI